MGKKKRKKKRTASNSDKYELYELSVQEPEADCDFVDQAWKEVRGRQPHSMREDFCASAITAIEWVKRGADNTAIGVDLDPTVLGVARKRITKRLKPVQRERMRLIEDDVLKVETEKVDCVLATNFSYYIFKSRRVLKRYFKRVLDALVDDGLMILDVYGGSDSFLEMKEPREVDGFTYVWDQRHYNPVNGDVINHIHFRFPDGSKMKSAFVYEWRLWTIPEISEMLSEAGFKDVTVYWEGSDDDGEGNGEWNVTKTGEACAGWVAYVVAAK
jgi:SAM-dependent methyltransferase